MFLHFFFTESTFPFEIQIFSEIQIDLIDDVLVLQQFGNALMVFDGIVPVLRNKGLLCKELQYGNSSRKIFDLFRNIQQDLSMFVGMFQCTTVDGLLNFRNVVCEVRWMVAAKMR